MELDALTHRLLLRPTRTGANSGMNQSEFLVITCNFLYAREKSRLQGAIGFGFAFHWLKKWREILKRITKPSNCNRVTTFDCHSKFALHVCCGWPRNRNKLAFSSLLTTLSQSAMSIAIIWTAGSLIADLIRLLNLVTSPFQRMIITERVFVQCPVPLCRPR